MAKFEVNGIDSLMAGLNDLEVKEMAPKMLEEAVPILEKHIRVVAEAHKITGSMVKSIKKTGAMVGKNGYYICVRPTGKDENGVRNMEKMVYLENGTSRQIARPVISEGVRKAEQEVLKILQEVFEREVVEK